MPLHTKSQAKIDVSSLEGAVDLNATLMNSIIKHSKAQVNCVSEQGAARMQVIRKHENEWNPQLNDSFEEYINSYQYAI